MSKRISKQLQAGSIQTEKLLVFGPVAFLFIKAVKCQKQWRKETVVFFFILPVNKTETMITAEPKMTKSIFFPEFFESNEYFIDEKVNFLKFHNEYKVYDNTATQVGSIVQRVSGWHKFLRLFLNKALFPFTLEIIDNNQKVLVTIRRGWTFWLSKITILDGEGALIGSIKQKFRLLKPRFQIFDNVGAVLAEINGDWKAWNFSITDAQGNSIGAINKKWAGIGKELFTTADKYYVTIVPEYAEDHNKIAIVATAITIDMVLKESK
jgi:uncharacterized protein YxjI